MAHRRKRGGRSLHHEPQFRRIRTEDERGKGNRAGSLTRSPSSRWNQSLGFDKTAKKKKFRALLTRGRRKKKVNQKYALGDAIPGKGWSVQKPHSEWVV